MAGQPLSQFQAGQNWNEFVNEMRYWMGYITDTISKMQVESGVTPEYVNESVRDAIREAKTYTDNAVKNILTVDGINVMFSTDLWWLDGGVYKATVRNSAFTVNSIPMLIFDNNTLSFISNFGVSPVCETGDGTLTITAATLPDLDFEGVVQLIN